MSRSQVDRGRLLEPYKGRTVLPPVPSSSLTSLREIRQMAPGPEAQGRSRAVTSPFQPPGTKHRYYGAQRLMFDVHVSGYGRFQTKFPLEGPGVIVNDVFHASGYRMLSG